VPKRFAEADLVSAKRPLEKDVDDEKEKKEGQRPEPAANIENPNRSGAAQSGALPDQDPADEESTQDEEKLDAVKAAVPEDRERSAEVRVKDAEAMGADHHHDGSGPEEIEAEDAAL